MKRIRLALLALVAAGAAAATLVSCGGGEPARPDVVLIVIDTLRPDHLELYGYEKETAPFLTRLAAHGVVFEKVRSTSSWTAPATASILTSLHPVQHGVLTGFKAMQVLGRVDPRISVNRVPEGVQTVAEAFREAGYSTWGVSDNVNICRALGFEAGFDRFEEYADLGAAQVNAAVKRWTKELGESRPYFLYLHYMDPHRPYKPHDPWFKPMPGELAYSISAYDSEIRYVDERIAELSELLRWDRGTMVVITSDHGEEFLDHGDWDHGRTLYEEVLAVPLVFAPSRDLRIAPRRIAEPVSLLDLVPTLREFAHLQPGASDQGISLLPFLRGEGAPPADRAFLSDLRSAPWFGLRTLKSIVVSNEKLIVTLPEQVELFDLVLDPRERNSLAGQRPDVARELRARIERFESECPKFTPETVSTTLDEEGLEKLRSLGYLK